MGEDEGLLDHKKQECGPSGAPRAGASPRCPHHQSDTLHGPAGLVVEDPRIIVTPEMPDQVVGPAFEVIATAATVVVPEVVRQLLVAAESL